MVDEPWKDPDLMEELYVERELSMVEIADKLDGSTSNMSYWLDNHGIERRSLSESNKLAKRKENADERERAVELYGQGKKPPAIAEEMGRPVMTVRCWLYQADALDENYECPTCGDWFDTINGMKVHHAKAHGKSIAGVETECHICGETVRKTRSILEKTERSFCSDECFNQFVSEFMKGKNAGENHPLWNGGEYEYGEGWNQTKKKKVRERDGYECQNCGMTQNEHLEKFDHKLHVHHIHQARDFDDPEERNSADNLTTLCASCHRQEDLQQFDVVAN